MNRTTSLILGIIVIAAIGWLVFYAYRSAGPEYGGNATSTPATGSSSSTEQSTAQVPEAGSPAVVTSASVAPSDTTAVVAGTVTPNGGLTSYWYEYGTTLSLGSKTSKQAVGSGYAAIPAPAYITGLSKNTAYYFRLVAENQFGRIAGAQYAFHTTQGNPPPVGSAPAARTLSANGISRTTANLNGEVTPNKSGTQYWFEYGRSAGLGGTTAFVSTGDGSAKISVSASLSALDPATTYYFRLNAQNQFGTVNGAIISFKTSGPPAPAAPSVKTGSATALGVSTVVLRGTVDPNGAETAYWFEYGTDPLFVSAVLVATARVSAGAGFDPVSVSADISGLVSRTTYYFRIAAQNDLGVVRGDRATFKTK